MSPSVSSVLRRTPYPYRAMVGICSDLDETPDGRAYWDIARLLNTVDDTPLGRGVGLEVGNSIYFEARPDEFSYSNTDDCGRAMVHALVRSGHIDCLHSFGDLVDTRAACGRALEGLDRYGCRLEVWVDHRTAPSNFGPDIMCGFGDVVGSPVYHADLSVAAGLTYVWRGRVTSVFGQNVRPRLRAVAPSRSSHRPIAVAKEVAKRLAGTLGSRKYRMHARNDLLRPIHLRSGQAVYEFMRSDPSGHGIGVDDGLSGLADRLSPEALEALVRSGGISLVYTHLGKLDPGPARFAPTLDALRRLAAEQRAGRIIVTTARRALGYCRAMREATVEIDEAEPGGGQRIRVSRGAAHAAHGLVRSDLDGLTFYVRDPDRACVVVDGVEEPGIVRNPPDETGWASVMLPWRWLTFPLL